MRQNIDWNLISMGGNSLHQYGLLASTIEEEHINRECAAETNYNLVELAEILRTLVHSLTVEQRTVYDRVCHSVDNIMAEILFYFIFGCTKLDGKSFLTKVILAQIRTQGKIALDVGLE